MKRTGNKKAYLKRQGLAFLLAMVIILSAIGPVGAVAVTEETTVPTTTGETVPNETQEITPISEGETTPAQETTAPTEETAAPTVETTAATEATEAETEATEAATEATEAVTEATEAVTEPTEETTEATEEATEPTEETVPEEIVEEGFFSAEALVADQTFSTLIDGMTLATDLGNRYFHMIMHRNDAAVMDNLVDNTDPGKYTDVLAAKFDTNTLYADAVAKLDADELTKWYFEPTGVSGEYYVKSAGNGSNVGKYIDFTNGTPVVLSDTGVATKVYSYTAEVTEGEVTKTVVRYALIQQDAETGTYYVLNQLGGAATHFNGFGGFATEKTIISDAGNLFLLKEAYANYAANVVENNTTLNATVKLFNYNDGINSEGLGNNGYYFIHGTGYNNYMNSWNIEDVKGNSVDGLGTKHEGVSGIGNPKMNPLLGTDGFPAVLEDTTNGSTVSGSMNYLFNGTHQVGETMSDGGGLFQKKGGYYVYDSISNAAWFNQETNRFVLYDVALSPSYTQSYYLGSNKDNTLATDGQSGNFLPFNKVTEDTVVNEGITQIGSSVPRYSVAPDVMNDMWFGMTVEFDFFMPKGGLMDGNPMEFDFHGDDDVFVYIDGVLILDIGGTHGSESGNINFATGEVITPVSSESTSPKDRLGDLLPAKLSAGGYEKTTLYTIMKTSGKEIADADFVDSDGDGELDTFKDWTNHNLKFFYMERGGNISYCRLKYNMIPLPEGAVNISKVLSESTTTALTEHYTYTFKIEKVNGSDVTPLVGVKYLVDGVTERTTQDGGLFTLEADQVATFVLDTQNAVTGEAGQRYRISEIVSESDNFTLSKMEYTGRGVGEVNNNSVEFTAHPDDKTNTVTHGASASNKLKTTDFSVTKQVKGNMGDLNKDYQFTATWYYDSTKATTLGTETFTLKSGATKEFKNIPLGAYVVVTEADYNEIGYDTTNSHGEGRVAIIDTLTNETEDDSIEFINEKNVPIDTGISLNSYPFILLLSTTLVAAFVLLMGKVRYGREY